MCTLVSKTKTLPFRSDENGSLTIFSLFIFLLILMMSGMAVDMIRHERMRVDIQNTIDTAVVAASSLTQAAQTEADVDALVREYVEKAGFDPSIVTVESDLQRPEGSEVVISRFVNARADFEINTVFMGLLGIEELTGGAASGASEGQQLIEIALVLDNSGSMRGDKLAELKSAAKEFVTTVLNNNSPERTIISIVPYAGQVHMSSDLKNRLNLNTTSVDLNTDAQAVLNPPVHPGAINAFVPGDTVSDCARFRDGDFATRSVADGLEIELLANFAWRNDGNFSTPAGVDRWCNDVTLDMLVFQNSETALHDHIDLMEASGWTAVDYGMNWGLGLLDASFQDIAQGMVDDNVVPASVAGSPVPFGTANVLKYVVLMTDGINTRQFDLKDEFKSGPTRIWYSEDQATVPDPNDPNAPGNIVEFNGFLVEMPDAPADQRWYVPGDPTTNNDDQNVADLPADAVQWDHHQLFERFNPTDAADYFFGSSDPAAFAAYSEAINQDLGFSQADTDLASICAVARGTPGTDEADDIEIYTIALEAPEAANNLLAECSGRELNHFNVVGAELSAAFNNIATQITQLRLTQ